MPMAGPRVAPGAMVVAAAPGWVVHCWSTTVLLRSSESTSLAILLSVVMCRASVSPNQPGAVADSPDPGALVRVSVAVAVAGAAGMAMAVMEGRALLQAAMVRGMVLEGEGVNSSLAAPAVRVDREVLETRLVVAAAATLLGRMVQMAARVQMVDSAMEAGVPAVGLDTAGAEMVVLAVGVEESTEWVRLALRVVLVVSVVEAEAVRALTTEATAGWVAAVEAPVQDRRAMAGSAPVPVGVRMGR